MSIYLGSRIADLFNHGLNDKEVARGNGKSKQEADAALHSMENRRAEAEAMGIQFRFKAFRAYACGNHWHCSSKPAHASLESFHAA